MNTVTLLANLAASIACAVIAIRLLTYRRKSSRYRRGISAFAWVLTNLGFLGAGWFAFQGIPHPALALIVALLIIHLAQRVIRHQGNLAQLMPGRWFHEKQH